MAFNFQERPWSRMIILRICKQRDISVLELAQSGRFIGRNLKKQLFKMLVEEEHVLYDDAEGMVFKKQVKNLTPRNKKKDMINKKIR